MYIAQGACSALTERKKINRQILYSRDDDTCALDAVWELGFRLRYGIRILSKARAAACPRV